MTISKDLFLVILAMDAYNQGYGRGPEHGETNIGNANVTLNAETALGPGCSPSARLLCHRL